MATLKKIKNFKDFIIEAKDPNQPKKPIIFAFGRFNPPHAGHAELVKTVQFLANKHNCHHEIVLSDTHDDKKNPLKPAEKLKHFKRMFPGVNVTVASRKEPSFFHHAKRYSDQKYDHLVMVTGGDRVHEFKTALTRYNGKELAFKKLNVVSAGLRDPNSQGVQGISSSKMRGYAKNNDFQSFQKGLPKTSRITHARDLFKATKKALFPKK